MSGFDPATRALFEALGSSDRTAQRLACDQIAERLSAEPALRDGLLDSLRRGNALARFAAAFVLFQVERPTMRLLPALLDALDIPDGDIRWQATHMLATLGRLEGEVLPVVLHEARQAQSPMRRRMALYALRELAPERAETCTAFVDALDDPAADVQRAALSCFAKLSDPDRAALDRVLEIARKRDDAQLTRLAAVVLPSLAEFHPEARGEVAALVAKLAQSDDVSLARAARAASQRMSGTPPPASERTMSSAQRRLILGSTSPRRRMLLGEAGFSFEVVPPDVEEVGRAGESPEAQARRLALEKARAAAARVDGGSCVLGADTLVVVDEDVLGKPADEDEAARMLLRIAGRTHRVLTGFALIVADARVEESRVVESAVRMREVTPEEARAYAAGGEPLDKAGAYAVQGDGGRFVVNIQGSRSNVIGLPLEAVIPLLEKLGVART